MRRAAAEVNSSAGRPNPAQTRFMASVTSSACRAKYSLTASLNNWLRDFLERPASPLRSRKHVVRNRNRGLHTFSITGEYRYQAGRPVLPTA